MLADWGEMAEARKVATDLGKTLAARNVKPAVLDEIRAFAAALGAAPEAPEARGGKRGGVKK